MNQTRVLVRNILSDWAGFAVGVVVTLFMTPFVLRSLGDARYGIWAVMMGITGYYGLLDMGFRAGLTQQLARHLGVRDFERLNRTASTGMVALAACGSIIAVASLVLSSLAPRMLSFPPELAREVCRGIVVIGVGTAVQFVFFPFSAVITAAQRNEIAGAIGVGTRLLQALATYAVLGRGATLVNLSVVVVTVNLVDYVLRCCMAYRLLPELRISPRLADRETMRSFTHVSVWNFIIQGSVRLISYTDTVLLAIFVPAAGIARFAIAGHLNEYFASVFRTMGTAFYPALAKLDARGEREAFRELYLGGSRISAVVTLVGAALMILWTEDFLRLWIGKSYLDSATYAAVPSVFFVLLGASVMHGLQRVGVQVLLALQRQRTCAFIFVAEGVLNLLASAALVPLYGLTGCALGTLIPAVVLQGVIQPVIVHRLLSISLGEYICQVLLRPLLASSSVLLIGFAVRGSWAVDRWSDLLLGCSVTGLVATTCVVGIGMSDTERRRFLVGPVSRFCAQMSSF